MRYFFLFVLLDNLVTSSLSYQVSRSSTILSLPLPLPSPAHPGTLKAPPCSHPRRTRLPRPEAVRQLSRGPQAPIRVGCRHAVGHLFLLLFCFQPTREQREKPGSTHKQIQSKETERQRFRGLPPERRRRGGQMPRGQGPYTDGTKCPITLSRLGRRFSWVAFTRTQAGGGSRLSPSHCP